MNAHTRLRVPMMLLLALFFYACSAANQLDTPQQAVTSQPAVAKQATPTAPQKHPLDQSEYRRFVLENGMKVLLVSDPRYNKSAAGVIVNVGSLSDPPEREGLAHFLEHMLFMGTEKYPGVDDYATYIQNNGGAKNAYTSRDHTNYAFEIKHEAFEGAVDRLAQFFIAPLFTPTYAEREINAVHSEFQSYIENDSWRTYQVQRSMFRKDHPAHMFNVGSQETLSGVKREELLTFYNQHYSANQMSLLMLGKAPLDTLESLARTYFSAVPNKNLKPLTYEPNGLPEKETFRLLQIEPIKDVRTLEITFPLPSFIADYESKPGNVLYSLIGHEGTGSLLSLLKREGLATGLSAGSWHETRDYGFLEISVSLTPKGLENYKEVVRYCHSYINLLKKSDYPSYYFQELRAKAQLDELYTDRGEGFDYIWTLGGNLAKYPLDVIERLPYLYTKEDPQAYQRMLSYLRPSNMLVTLIAKGVPTDQTEPYYGTKYGYSEDNAFYATLKDVPPNATLHLPEPNPFMPKQAAIPNRQQKEGIIPTKILDETGVELYYAQDAEFLRPKVSLRYKIRFPKENMSLRFKVLLDVYTASVNESLNELAYPASLAGLNYSFANAYEGVYFSINGFDESAAKLFSNVLEHMQHLKITEQVFEGIKDRTLRNLKDFPKQDAWRIARFKTYETLLAVEYRPEEQIPVVEKLTLADIQTFAQTLYKRAAIEALIYGNVPADEAVTLTRQMQKTLGIQPISKKATFEQTYLRQPEPEALWFVSKLEVNNSCFWRQYYMGANTPQNRAIAMILDAFVDRPFFTELRSNQQLGYIVSGGVGPTRDQNSIYGYFIIQSDGYPADEVENRVDAFVSTYPQQFKDLPDENFEALRAAAIAELKKKEKTISEKADVFNNQAFSFNGDFQRDKEAIAALEALTRGEVGAALETMLSEKTRRMRTTLAFARDHEATRPVESSVKDLNAWKKTRTYEK